MNKVDITRSKRILLIAPYLVKRVGGMGTWSINVLDYINKTRIVDLKFQNTALNVDGYVQRNIFLRIFYGIIHSFRIILQTIKNLFFYKPSTVHYTSSASFALFKDYLIAYMVTKVFKTHFVMHWHFGRIPILETKNNWEWHWLLRVSKLCSYSIVIDRKSLLTMQAFISNVVFIPNPISQSLECEAKKMIDIKRNPIGGEVVFVGQVIKTKGVCELVEACSKLESLKKLIIIGPCGERLKKHLISLSQVKDHGRWIIFKGEIVREKVFDEIKRASCLCLPSYTEGFPNVVMEAMALRVPVVATDVGAIDDMLDVTSKIPAGICVPVKDVETLRKALAKVLDNVSWAEQLGRNGNQRVLNCYTIERIVKQYDNLWK